MNAELLAEAPALVARGLELGWIKPRADRELTPDGYLRRRLVAQYHERGLNSIGKPRRNIARPELAGLTGSAYRRAYKRLVASAS